MVEATQTAEYPRFSLLDEAEVIRRANLPAQDLDRIGFKTFRLSSPIYRYPDLETRDGIVPANIDALMGPDMS